MLVHGGGGDDAAEDSDAALQSRDLVGSFDINGREDFEFTTGFAAKVREKLATHVCRQKLELWTKAERLPWHTGFCWLNLWVFPQVVFVVCEELLSIWPLGDTRT